MEIDVDCCLDLMRRCAVAIFLEERRARQKKPIAPRVKAFILATMMDKHRRLDLELAAAELAMSAPTLRRKLLREGTGFQQLGDEVRLEVAKELLLAGMIIDDIADKLCFAGASSFSRAFKDWTGVCPLDWVKNELGLERRKYHVRH